MSVHSRDNTQKRCVPLYFGCELKRKACLDFCANNVIVSCWYIFVARLSLFTVSSDSKMFSLQFRGRWFSVIYTVLCFVHNIKSRHPEERNKKKQTINSISNTTHNQLSIIILFSQSIHVLRVEHEIHDEDIIQIFNFAIICWSLLIKFWVKFLRVILSHGEPCARRCHSTNTEFHVTHQFDVRPFVRLFVVSAGCVFGWCCKYIENYWENT